MNYKINWDEGGVFAVPESVVDNGFKLASGKWVKVLVYLLRFRRLPENPSDIGVTSEDVEEALAYWEEQGIIYKTAQPEKTVTENVQSAPQAMSAPKPAPEHEVKILAPVPEQSAPAEEKRTIPGKPSKALLPTEIADRIAQSEEIAFLFRSAESSLKRVLTFDDQRTILWFYDHLGLSADVITMLIAYCCSIGRVSMAYIQKIAESWFEKNISTYEQAESEILCMQKAFSFESKVQSRLKLQDKLTAAQKKYIDEWALWDIPIDMVELAYDKTVDVKGKPDFNYINGILRKWHENGITDAAAAESFDDRPKKAAAQKGTKKAAQPAPPSSSFDLSLILEHAKNSTPTV